MKEEKEQGLLQEKIVPCPHHKNEILKLLNDLHTLSNSVNKRLLAAASSLHSHCAMCNCCVGCSPSLSCGDSGHAATPQNEDEWSTFNTCLMHQ
jgi:hypothetical protein